MGNAPRRFVGSYGSPRRDRHLLSESRFSFPIDHGLRRGVAESCFPSWFRDGSVVVPLPNGQGYEPALPDPELVVAECAATGALVLGESTRVEFTPPGGVAVAVPEVVVEVVPADTAWRVAGAAVHRDGNRRAGCRSGRSGLGGCNRAGRGEERASECK